MAGADLAAWILVALWLGGMSVLAHEWSATPALPAPALHPARPSQLVSETVGNTTPDKQHVVITLERTSTGGTRHEAQFKRAMSGPMSAAERTDKKRAKAFLFPKQWQQKLERARRQDVERKRKAAAAKKAERQLQQGHQQQIGMVRWPMSADERAAKKSKSIINECDFCFAYILETDGMRPYASRRYCITCANDVEYGGGEVPVGQVGGWVSQ